MDNDQMDEDGRKDILEGVSNYNSSREIVQDALYLLLEEDETSGNQNFPKIQNSNNANFWNSNYYNNTTLNQQILTDTPQLNPISELNLNSKKNDQEHSQQRQIKKNFPYSQQLFQEQQTPLLPYQQYSFQKNNLSKNVEHASNAIYQYQNRDVVDFNLPNTRILSPNVSQQSNFQQTNFQQPNFQQLNNSPPNTQNLYNINHYMQMQPVPPHNTVHSPPLQRHQPIPPLQRHQPIPPLQSHQPPPLTHQPPPLTHQLPPLTHQPIPPRLQTQKKMLLSQPAHQNPLSPTKPSPTSSDIHHLKHHHPLPNPPPRSIPAGGGLLEEVDHSVVNGPFSPNFLRKKSSYIGSDTNIQYKNIGTSCWLSVPTSNYANYIIPVLPQQSKCLNQEIDPPQQFPFQ